MFDLGDRGWLFYGLLFSAAVFLSLGSNGLGVGGSFQAWGAFLDVIKTVAVLEIIAIIVAFVLSLLPLLVPLLVALFGAYVFSRIFGSGNTASMIEDTASKAMPVNLPTLLIFILFLFLLL